MATLDGKRVVVIGGASGVGFAVAEAALAAGERKWWSAPARPLAHRSGS